MSDDLKFSGAEANLFVHATEDLEKVLKSIERLLLIPEGRFSGTSSEGHFKNKILMLKAIVSSSEASELALRITSGLNSADKEELRRHLEQFSDDKGTLYLRLDKQRLCQGKISISSSDSLRIKFKPVKRYKPTSYMDNYRGLLTSE